MSDPIQPKTESTAPSIKDTSKLYFRNILWGIAAGFVFGLLQLIFLSGYQNGGLDVLLVPTFIGAILGGLTQKFRSFEMVAWGATIGGILFIISAVVHNWVIFQHAIVGIVTGILLAAFSKISLYFAK